MTRILIWEHGYSFRDYISVSFAAKYGRITTFGPMDCKCNSTSNFSISFLKKPGCPLLHVLPSPKLVPEPGNREN